MSLQNLFYTMGIVFMGVMFIIMISLVVLIFYIKKKADDIHKMAEKKIDMFLRPAEAAFGTGSQIAMTAFETVRSMMQKKKRKSD